MNIRKEGSNLLLHTLFSIIDRDRVSTNETILEQHSKDESYHTPILPDVVVYPISKEEVQSIVQIANELKVPIVPFGIGSSLEGHAIPVKGGISLDFTLMNKIIDIRPSDFLVKVQPGVTRTQLNNELKKYGLFFSVDPGADATLGGMAATNASGTTSVKYGVMRDQVRNLEVILPNGDIMETGNLAAKSSSGYHLNGLFVGSEGTLGIFTELTLRVYGIPEHITAARASFPTINDAVQSVITLLSAGIQLARVELVDQQSIIQVNKYKKTSYIEQPTLFIELHGNEGSLKEDVEIMNELLTSHGLTEIIFEEDTKSRNQLWEARHHLAYSFIHGFPGKKQMSTDVCLPYSKLAEGIRIARKSLDEAGLPGGIVGHVGDGNYHALVMIDVQSKEELQKAEIFNEKIVSYALANGGTCTGEHGVGIGKAKYQQQEHGTAYYLMKQIKQIIDPNLLFNPGKIFID